MITLYLWRKLSENWFCNNIRVWFDVRVCYNDECIIENCLQLTFPEYPSSGKYHLQFEFVLAMNPEIECDFCRKSGLGRVWNLIAGYLGWHMVMLDGN